MNLLPDQNLLKQSTKIPFKGLHPRHIDETDVPDHLERKIGLEGDDVVSFADVVDLLPTADVAELRTVNQFVDEDGSVDLNAIDDVDGLDSDAAIEALDEDRDDIHADSQYDPLEGRVAIVDRRREALAALGYSIKYHWQVASRNYGIISPRDGYQPAVKTFEQYDESTNIFGWVDYRDYGGTVDIYILFTNQVIGDDGSLSNPLYLGYHTGYDFCGQKKFFLNHFGYYSKFGTRLHGIGHEETRKHVGNPTNKSHERSNERVPIQEWFNQAHKLFLEFDDFETDVHNASEITVDFEDQPFGVCDFYRLLGLPQSHAENASARLLGQANHADEDTVEATVLSLGFSLAFALQTEFTGDKSGARFRTFSRTAVNIIRKPELLLKRALREYQEGTLDDAESDEQQSHAQTYDFGSLSAIEDADDLDGLEGINVGDLTIPEKSELLQTTEQALLGNY